MPFPHPRKIYNVIRIVGGSALLAAGFAGTFFPTTVLPGILSALPSEMFSIARENIFMMAAFVSMILGFVLLFVKKG